MNISFFKAFIISNNSHSGNLSHSIAPAHVQISQPPQSRYPSQSLQLNSIVAFCFAISCQLSAIVHGTSATYWYISHLPLPSSNTFTVSPILTERSKSSSDKLVKNVFRAQGKSN